MQLWAIAVPTEKRVKNGKNPYFTIKFHRLWDEKVRSITGGLTICPPTKGVWTAPCGEIFRERMIIVQIACTREQIEEIADFTAKHYLQKAIFFYKVSDDVVIKHYGESK